MGLVVATLVLKNPRLRRLAAVKVDALADDSQKSVPYVGPNSPNIATTIAKFTCCS